MHQMRLLISEKQIIRKVTKWNHGQLTTHTYVTRGPVACISTTTKPNKDIEVDDLTRNLSIFCDATAEQTRQIVKEYTKPRKRLSRAELRAWRAVQRLLEEKAQNTVVVFPEWFDSVADRVFVDEVSVRRYYPAFVEACRTVCLIRSFQSRKTVRNN